MSLEPPSPSGHLAAAAAGAASFGPPGASAPSLRSFGPSLVAERPRSRALERPLARRSRRLWATAIDQTAAWLLVGIFLAVPEAWPPSLGASAPPGLALAMGVAAFVSLVLALPAWMAATNGQTPGSCSTAARPGRGSSPS